MPAKKKNGAKKSANVDAAEMARRARQSAQDKARAASALRPGIVGQPGKKRRKATAKQRLQYSEDRMTTLVKSDRLTTMMRSAVGRSIVFPYDHPLRLVSNDPARTALQPCRSIETITAGQNLTQFDPTMLGMLGVCLFGLPGLSYAYTKEYIPSNTNMQYYRMNFAQEDKVDEKFTLKAAIGGLPQTILSDFEVPIMSSSVFLPIIKLTGNSSNIHGGLAPVGKANSGGTWFYLGKGDNVFVTFGITGTFAALDTKGINCTLALSLLNYDESDVEVVESYSMSLVALTAVTAAAFVGSSTYCSGELLAGKQGWYTVRIDSIRWETTDPVAMSIYKPVVTDAYCYGMVILGNTCSMGQTSAQRDAEWLAIRSTPQNCTYVGNPTVKWAFRTSQFLDPDRQGDMWMGRECRNNGTSLLLSNTTQLINRGGNIYATRFVQSGAMKFDTITLQQMQTGTFDKHTFDAATGCFTFMLPDEGRLKLFEAVPIPASNGGPLFDLDLFKKMWIHIAVISPPVTLGFNNTFQLTYDETIEFRDFSNRYNKDTQHIPIQAYIDAIVAFQERSDWWYENPTHAQRLYSWISQAMAGAKKLAKASAPYVAAGVSTVHPEMAPLMQMMQRMLR